MIKSNVFQEVLSLAQQYKAKLIVVSKLQSIEDIMEVYKLGHREFGENRVQSMMMRKENLPQDILWHMIGTLQKNKVKYLVPWINCIHSIDHFDLAYLVNKEALKYNCRIPVLLEIKISPDTTKQGFSENEIKKSLETQPWTTLKNILPVGLMGMASYTDDQALIRSEFKKLHSCYEYLKAQYPAAKSFSELSMGMSNDYKIALDEGSTMLRIGSLFFQ